VVRALSNCGENRGVNAREWLSNAGGRFGRRVRPALAHALVHLATLPARVGPLRRGPKRVLVDNTVLAHAITHESAWVSTGTSKWGPHDIETGYSARVPVRDRDSRSRESDDICYLTGLAHLARQGRVSLLTSAALWEERVRHPAGRYSGYGYYDLNLFSGVEFDMVDRMPDTVFGPDGRELGSAEAQRMRLDSVTDPLYRGLVALLGPGNSQDAWHIWTAEAHAAFCFLTMDYKLCRTLEARRHQEPVRSLKTQVLTPRQLAWHLAYFPVNPHRFTFTDADFPVRGDLSWPNQRRNRPPKQPRR
jgi:hypothetical protein